jgi:hypothetical protein
MTGVPLFERETRQEEYREPVDESAMLRSLGRGGGDDLEELRRMIKKTEKNLRMYSQSVRECLCRFTRLRVRWWMWPISADGSWTRV